MSTRIAAIDTQIDRTLFRKDVLSLRGTYIHENSDLASSASVPLLRRSGGITGRAPSEHFYGQCRIPFRQSLYRAHSVGSIPSGTVDTLLYPAGAVSGNANGDPRSAGYIVNFSYWPWQNLQLAAQYTGYTRFNGGANNYDGSGRNASGNNTIYLDAKFIF